MCYTHCQPRVARPPPLPSPPPPAVFQSATTAVGTVPSRRRTAPLPPPVDSLPLSRHPHTHTHLPKPSHYHAFTLSFKFPTSIYAVLSAAATTSPLSTTFPLCRNHSPLDKLSDHAATRALVPFIPLFRRETSTRPPPHPATHAPGVTSRAGGCPAKHTYTGDGEPQIRDVIHEACYILGKWQSRFGEAKCIS